MPSTVIQYCTLQPTQLNRQIKKKKMYVSCIVKAYGKMLTISEDKGNIYTNIKGIL